MKYLEWKSAEKKPATGDENLCLVWVYDESIEIGYCWNELCCWTGKEWFALPSSSLSYPVEDDSIVVMYWCYVPRSKNKIAP